MTTLIWPFALSTVSSDYGDTKGRANAHGGVDFAIRKGTAIKAGGPGKVVHSGWQNDRAGYAVTVQYDNGIRAMHCHVGNAGRIANGTRVDAGTVLAKVDTTGNSTGPHLHLEAYKAGKLVNPHSYYGNTVPAAGAAPAFPLPAGSYFGWRSGGRKSISGYFNNRHHLRQWQQRMRDRGWPIDADGLYAGQTNRITVAFQKEKGLVPDGKIGPATWAAAWTAPIT